MLLRDGNMAGGEKASEPKHTPVSHWTSLTKYESKDKIIKNFKLATTEH